MNTTKFTTQQPKKPSRLKVRLFKFIARFMRWTEVWYFGVSNRFIKSPK